MFKKYKIVPEIITITKYYVVYELVWIFLIPYYKFVTLSSTLEGAEDYIKFLEQPTVYV